MKTAEVPRLASPEPTDEDKDCFEEHDEQIDTEVKIEDEHHKQLNIEAAADPVSKLDLEHARDQEPEKLLDQQGHDTRLEPAG